MKQVDPTKFTIIKAGKAHTTDGTVNIKQIISIMERNESYIFWLQPKNASVQAQFPCIQINGIFYQLNLRLEKVIFRHVRLTRLRGVHIYEPNEVRIKTSRSGDPLHDLAHAGKHQLRGGHLEERRRG